MEFPKSKLRNIRFGCAGAFVYTLALSLFQLFSIDAEMLRCGGCVEDVRDECGLVFLDMCEEEEEEGGGGGGRRRRRREE